MRRDPLVRGLLALGLPPRRALTAVALGTGALTCAIGLMAVSAWLIARAAQQPPIMYLSVAVVATRALGLGRGVLRYAERLAGHDVALRGAVNLRERLYARLAAGDQAVVASLHRGDLLTRLGADADALAEVAVRGLLPFAVVWTTGLLTIAGLALVLPSAAAAVAASTLLATVVAPWLVGRAAAAVERDTARLRAELAAETLTLLDGAEELAVAGVAEKRLDRIAGLQRGWAARVDGATRPSGWAALLSTLASGGAVVLSLVLASSAVADGRLSSVMLAVVALTALAAAEGSTGLPAAASALLAGRAAAERLLPLLDLEPVDRPGPEPLRDGETALLVAEGLSAGWPEGPVVTRDVSVRVAPGEVVTVRGESGAGKTTLLLTLAGILPARGGRVRTASSTLFTGEDAHVFATTVRENLRLADPTADDLTLASALARAGLAGWLAGLPDGLDTMLGSGGHDVSGGERRRLLVARALLSPARVLLFDEPTEHLDPATADRLLTDLAVLANDEGRTVVLATHAVPGNPAGDGSAERVALRTVPTPEVSVQRKFTA